MLAEDVTGIREIPVVFWRCPLPLQVWILSELSQTVFFALGVGLITSYKPAFSSATLTCGHLARVRIVRYSSEKRQDALAARRPPGSFQFPFSRFHRYQDRSPGQLIAAPI